MPVTQHAMDILLQFVGQNALSLLATVGLLLLSATFSGCETSLFSLTAPQLNQLRKSSGRVDKIITSLVAELKSLLPTILFCNMAINVMVFALSASMAAGVGETLGAAAAFLFSVASLFLVVFFGEVFPKQFAISASLTVARLTSVQVWACHRLLAKPMRILNWVVAACERVLQFNRDSSDLRDEELKLLVELSKRDGVISEGEYELIDGIVDLPDVRIRDLMVPRVDVQSIPAGSTLEHAYRTARESRHCKLPVHNPDGDDMAGWIDIRDIFIQAGGDDNISPGESVDGYIKHFRYFSEHDRADQALERIKGAGAELFAVVDERGRLVGFFTMQDVMDEVLGHFGEHGAPPEDEIRELDGGYVIPGRLSVREWRELFPVTGSIPKSATVGGLVTSLLGRLPRTGDTVRLENMEITVLSTRRNHVMEVMLRLSHPEPVADREDG
ncbi:MAG: hemolysin family protein [Planctomycetes bacterium]|nr:hemolysin family protein [Planctomycetota bacterium]